MPEEIEALCQEGIAVRREFEAARGELADLKVTQDGIAGDLKKEKDRNRRWHGVVAALVVLFIGFGFVVNDNRRRSEQTRRQAAELVATTERLGLVQAQLAEVVRSQAAQDKAARVRDCESRNDTRASARGVWAGQQAFNAIILGSVADPSKLPPESRKVFDDLVKTQTDQAQRIAETYADVDCTKV